MINKFFGSQSKTTVGLVSFKNQLNYEYGGQEEDDLKAAKELFYKMSTHLLTTVTKIKEIIEKLEQKILGLENQTAVLLVASKNDFLL